MSSPDSWSGAGRLIVAEARDAPFVVSRAYGATECINVAVNDAKEAVADLTDGAGADVVIETSGYPASSAIVLDVVRKEGKVAHIGWANDLPPLPVIPIMAKTLTVFGVGGIEGRRGDQGRADALSAVPWALSPRRACTGRAGTSRRR